MLGLRVSGAGEAASFVLRLMGEVRILEGGEKHLADFLEFGGL